MHAAAAVRAGDVALVMRRVDPWPDDGMAGDRGLRAGSSVAAEVASSVEIGSLSGAALAHAQAMVSAAITTLERLGDLGWRTVSGEVPAAGRTSSGRDAVAERSEPFDPFEPYLGPRG